MGGVGSGGGRARAGRVRKLDGLPVEAMGDRFRIHC